MQRDYTLLYLTRIEPDEDDRTPAKDDAATQIEGLWGLPLAQIAERTGYSRQHIKNTLDDYFELHEEPPEGENVIEPQSHDPEPTSVDTGGFNLDIPEGLNAEQYVKGYSMASDVDDLESFLQGMMKRYMERR